MKYYFAPMEGLTDSIFRRLHHRYFGGVDSYYMPFFSPAVHRSLSRKEERELPPADTEPFSAVPQVLTRNAGDFLWAAELAARRGYRQIDLNIGCPSGTVVAKGKGAGMLADPDGLDAFLQEIFSRCPIAISVKTRLGMADPEEFPGILEVLNRYPIALLTIHPRVRKDFYRHPVRTEAFRYALEHSRNPLCFNGNLTDPDQLRCFREAFPQVDAVMLGRGLIGDPGMLAGENTPRQLQLFYDELLRCYTETFGSSRNAMFRLKENWRYLLCHFENSEKLGKKLRKTTDLREYQAITREIFSTLPFLPHLHPDW